MTMDVTIDNNDPVTPETIAGIEVAANALKGVKEACSLTDAKPEFMNYLLKCGPATVSALCYTLKVAWQWKREAIALLERYDAVAETFGGELGSSKVTNLERGVAELRARIEKQDAIISRLARVRTRKR